MHKTWTFSSWGPVEHRIVKNVSSCWHCRKIHFTFVRWSTISKALPDVCFWCTKCKYIQGAVCFPDVRMSTCLWKPWISVKGERNQEFLSHYNAFVKIWWSLPPANTGGAVGLVGLLKMDWNVSLEATAKQGRVWRTVRIWCPNLKSLLQKRFWIYIYKCLYRYIIWQVNNVRKEMSHRIFQFSFSLHYFSKMFIYKRWFALMYWSKASWI